MYQNLVRTPLCYCKKSWKQVLSVQTVWNGLCTQEGKWMLDLLVATFGSSVVDGVWTPHPPPPKINSNITFARKPYPFMYSCIYTFNERKLFPLYYSVIGAIRITLTSKIHPHRSIPHLFMLNYIMTKFVLAINNLHVLVEKWPIDIYHSLKIPTHWYTEVENLRLRTRSHIKLKKSTHSSRASVYTFNMALYRRWQKPPPHLPQQYHLNV